MTFIYLGNFVRLGEKGSGRRGCAAQSSIETSRPRRADA